MAGRRWFRTCLLGLPAALLTCTTLVACDDDAAPSGAEPRELTVSAAASLTDAFTEIAAGFEQQHEGVTVALNFGPSDGLANQIHEGAPVDVFASASQTWMDAVQDDGPGVGARVDFATNELAIIVPSANPAGIDDVADLGTDGVKLVVAAEGVPAGDYAREMLDNAGIADAALANVVSNEEDVRAVVTKVLSGDADAGITYVTDVTADVVDGISIVEVPDEVNVIATYPVAIVSGSQEANLAQLFIDHVIGPGQQTLAAFGFQAPA
jgi:molybdate transport system substrate-binding protein